MKTLILLLTLSFLMNCYSYQTVNTENMNSGYDPGKTYELRLQDNTKILAKNLVRDGETYHFSMSSGKERTLSADTVKLIRERTYQRGKTIGLTLGIIGGVAAVVLIGGAIAFSNWDIDWGE